MVSFKERLKAKLGRKDPPTSPLAEASSTTITLHAQAVSDPATPPSILPERLWNQAYDLVKASDPSTVDAYESILSARLSEQDAGASDPPHPADLASQQNKIAQDADKRRMQMQRLVQHGLRRTEKDAKVKQDMEDGTQAVMAVKEIVDKAIQASPEAAIAWVGVCFALEILMNPLTQASSNRQGIAHVVSRMDWYWNLSSLLLEENMIEAHPQGLRGELEKIVIQLYAKLLLYQMESVCYYHRSRLSLFARDLIKLDDWDGKLSDIQAAEAAVQADSAQYTTLSIRTRLGAIAETGKSQSVKLDSISSAIREQTKQQERIHEMSVDNKCLADLRLTDPRDDKRRIEATKGGLLQDSYRWVLENADFQNWRNDPQNQLLWIKADPGKGKTMLLCGIIDELQKSIATTELLSYFFCQATDSRINSATAVLRGLLYLLVNQQPSLVSHIREKYNHAGKTLFEDTNAWVALVEIFTNILQDPSLNNTYLIIDALDECVVDLPKLLDFVAQKSSSSSRVKWIVSSRSWQDIEEQLTPERAGHKVKLSLELNAESVSNAVSIFIERRVLELAERKKYDERTRTTVLDYLSSNADDTFLWVALVCQNLKGVPKRNAIKKLNTFPPGLDSLYERMMLQISTSDDADVCKQILGTAAIAYRPLTLQELIALVETFDDMADDLPSIREIVGLCGSFLTLRGDTIYFVHQSAKDFLSTKASCEVFPFGNEKVHRTLFSRSLQAMSSTLHRDMYDLRELGYLAEEAKQPNPDPLAASRYSCIYWINHLCKSGLGSTKNEDDRANLRDGGAVDKFLREKYLYWLEALSLCQSMSKGIVSMIKLAALVQKREDVPLLSKLIEDALRFIMYHKVAIENGPLQAYASALLFSPAQSLIKGLFKEEAPRWITIEPPGRDSWSACLQTLEGHGGAVYSVAFSPDSEWLASASYDEKVKVWNPTSGACLHTLQGHGDWVNSVAFSPDSKWLASASGDKTVRVWDASSSNCLYTLQGHNSEVNSVAFSPDSKWLASASDDKTVKVWDANSGDCLHALQGHNDRVNSVAFSPDLKWLASASADSTVKVWDANSGDCLHTLQGHNDEVNSVAFSPDSKWLASASADSTVKVWNPTSGACLHTLQGHGDWVNSVAFSPDSKWLASALDDSMVKIWDASSGDCLHTLQGHSSYVYSVAFSPNSKWLASASMDKTTKIWDIISGTNSQLFKGHRHNNIGYMAFSPDSKWLASVSVDGTVKVWIARSCECLHTLQGHTNSVTSVAFSPNSKWLASGSDDGTTKIWDLMSGASLRTFEGHSRKICSVTFSPDSKWLASASSDTMVKIWDLSSGDCLNTFQGHSNWVRSVAFSPNSKWLASASNDKVVKVWDAGSGECLYTLQGHSNWVGSVAFSPDSKWLASASDKTIKVWSLTSGVCLQTLHVDEAFPHISFDSSGSCLHTETGPIAISSPLVSSTTAGAELQNPAYQNIALSSDRVWITLNSKKVLWLPSEYRPLCLAMSRNTIGIGTGSGEVWIVKVELNE